MSRRNESTEFLLECMADSLFSLMKEKVYGKITIDEITEKAGVGRATYFRHFGNKEELVIYKLKLCWNRWAKEAGLRTMDSFDLENTEAFFQFNYANKELFLLTYEAGLSQTILLAFDAIFAEQGDLGEQQYANAFFKYGLFGVLNAWILNGFKESPEEMIKIGKTIISSIVYDAARKNSFQISKESQI